VKPTAPATMAISAKIKAHFSMSNPSSVVPCRFAARAVSSMKRLYGRASGQAIGTKASAM